MTANSPTAGVDGSMRTGVLCNSMNNITIQKYGSPNNGLHRSSSSNEIPRSISYSF